MSEYTTPVTTAFELQRTAIEGGQRAVRNGIEFQKRLNAAAVDGLESQEEAQRRTFDLTRSAIHSYLDAIEATVPGGAPGIEEVRETVDEQFATVEEAYDEAVDAAGEEFEKNADVYDDLATGYLSAMDEQIELALEAHEQIEDQTVETVELTAEQLEQAEEQFEQAQALLEEQTEQFQVQFQEQTEQFQAQFEALQDQIEELQERTQERVEA